MHVEYLIIGQGISGTFLSYYLSREQKSFLVIDDNNKDSPSRIAAGIINPVTGRRMVTVWMADEVIPFAQQAYEQIGSELNITAISQKNIIDFFPNPFMRENFLKRLNEGNEYIESITTEEHYNNLFRYEFGCGIIKPVYIAHTETLLPAWRQQLTARQSLLSESFDLQQLKITPDNIYYKDIVADKIIFCDGGGSFNSPYFKLLPFAPNKGEALIVEIPDLPASNIFKKSVLLAPVAGPADHLFWAGSNYIWDFDNDEPTAAFREATERSLKEWLKLPFKILEHRAGVRPATLERRPFAGMHPQLPNIGILNGMGTKGCSLAPFFARQLTDHLVHNSPLSTDADVKRFAGVLARS